jgi:hypothetical protein
MCPKIKLTATTNMKAKAFISRHHTQKPLVGQCKPETKELTIVSTVTSDRLENSAILLD